MPRSPEEGLADLPASMTLCCALQPRRGFHGGWGRCRPECLDLRKGLSGGVQNGVYAAYSVQPAKRDIAVGRIYLDAVWAVIGSSVVTAPPRTTSMRCWPA